MSPISIYYFKHTWTGLYACIELNKEISICDLKNTIDEQIKTKLMVNNDYKIIIVGQKLMELAEPIDLDSTDKFLSFGKRYFYIRPENEPIPHNILERKNRKNSQIQCSLCYQDYSQGRFSYWRGFYHNTICSDNNNCCQNCIENWIDTCTQRSVCVTCPFCRSIL
jgi:hypothetical protein